MAKNRNKKKKNGVASMDTIYSIVSEAAQAMDTSESVANIKVVGAPNLKVKQKGKSGTSDLKRERCSSADAHIPVPIITLLEPPITGPQLHRNRGPFFRVSGKSIKIKFIIFLNPRFSATTPLQPSTISTEETSSSFIRSESKERQTFSA
ncbi:hypothetical protein RYX36_017905 [Vicia faba]